MKLKIEDLQVRYSLSQKDARAAVSRSTYFRNQQLPASVVVAVLKKFARCHAAQAPSIVVDPFVGSGSTALAARMLGCMFNGGDKDPRCLVILHLTTFVCIFSVVGCY